MTSLFTAFVARGADVPELDPRLISHVDVRVVAVLDEGPAAPQTEVIAPVIGDGTTS